MKNKIMDEYSIFFHDSNKDRLAFLNMSLLKSNLIINNMIKYNFELTNIITLAEFPTFDELWSFANLKQWNIINQTDYIFYYFFYLSNYVKNIVANDKSNFILTEAEFSIFYEYICHNLEQLNNILDKNDRHFKSTITNNTYCYIENLYVLYYIIAYKNQAWFNNSFYIHFNNTIDKFTDNQILNCLTDGDIIRKNVINDVANYKYSFTKSKNFNGFVDYIKNNQLILMKKHVDASDILDIFNK